MSHDRPSEPDPDETDGPDDTDGKVSRRAAPPIRHQLIVLGICIVGLIVGIVLLVTGRSSSDAPRTAPEPSAVSHGPLLPDLGVVADEEAARTLIGDLDPAELRLGDAATATSPPDTTASAADLSAAGLQRCQGAIAQQTSDRSLGDQLAAARLVVGSTPAFVVSYTLPASGERPAGQRVVVADAMTCRILAAVDH